MKKVEINEFSKLKNMNEEIKEWKTRSGERKVAMLLIMDGVSFSYTEEEGIVFTVPEFYVERLKERLVNCYGCSKEPIITEYEHTDVLYTSKQA